MRGGFWGCSCSAAMVLQEVGLENLILSVNRPALPDRLYRWLLSSFLFKSVPNLNRMPVLLQIIFRTVPREDGHLVS